MSKENYVEVYGDVFAYVDLTLPAVVAREFLYTRALDGYKANRDDYLGAMTFTPEQMVSFANGLKSLDLGRVWVKFDTKMALEEIQKYPEIFERIDGYNAFQLRFSKDGTPREEQVRNIVLRLMECINYAPNVLATCGLDTYALMRNSEKATA